MNFLLIDDEPFSSWVPDYLEERGQSVIWAKNVEQARTLIAQQTFQWCIVDVVMAAPSGTPDPDEAAQTIGLKLCKEILSTKWGKGRVIVYSAFDQTQLLERSKRVGLNPNHVTFFSKRDETGTLERFLERTIKANQT